MLMASFICCMAGLIRLTQASLELPFPPALDQFCMSFWHPMMCCCIPAPCTWAQMDFKSHRSDSARFQHSAQPCK